LIPGAISAVASGTAGIKDGRFKLGGELGGSALSGGRFKAGFEVAPNDRFASALGEAIFDVKQGNAFFLDMINPLASTGREIVQFLFDLAN